MVIDKRQIAGRQGLLCIATGAVLASTAAMPARAQTVDDPVNELAFTADLRHDTNVARSDDVRAAQRGLEKADERLSLGVSLLVGRPLGRHHLTVDAYAGYDFYRRNSRLNRERIATTADLEVNAGPCAINLMPQFNRRQSELYDIAYIDVPGINSIRNTETTQVYRGELRCGRQAGFRPLAFYERSYGDNSNPLRRISDYRGESYGGGVSYNNPVLGDFDLSLERQTLRYPNRPAALGLSGYRVDQAKLAFSRSLGAVLAGHGYVAYTHLKPRNGGVRDFKGISWSLGLTAAPLPDLQLGADLSQSVQPSLGNDALYSRDRNWMLRASYFLGPRTSISLMGSRNERSYRGATGVLGPLLSHDRLDRVSARIDFRPAGRLTLGAEAGHERRNANGTFYDYNSSYVALNTRFSLGR